MRPAAALAAALALAACAGLEGGAALDPLDQVTVDLLREQGDVPEVVRPVEHFLLPVGATDRAGLAAALAAAGFETAQVRPVRGFEVEVVFRSDARAPTLARQIAWLEANAPAYGYRHTGWGTRAQTG